MSREQSAIRHEYTGLEVESDALGGSSLALIGNASAHEGRAKICIQAEAFSIRRLEGSRWRLRRTLVMGIEWRFCA